MAQRHASGPRTPVALGRVGCGRRPRHLIIDLAAVDVIDSAGLRAIVPVRRTWPAVCPVLRSPHRQVRRMLELTGFSAVFALET